MIHHPGIPRLSDEALTVLSTDVPTIVQRHLTEDELAAFASGRISDSQWQLVEKHVRGCSYCATRLHEQPEDSLLRQVGELDVSTAVECNMTWENARYEILRPLGCGGMGQVYLARHCLLDRLVALKFKKQPTHASESFCTRFLHEMKTQSALNHPNIARAIDAESTSRGLMLVVEYEPGDDLSSYVHHHGPLCPQEALRLSFQAVAALQHAYQQGFLHRDIKPGNLYRCETGQLKLLDFGLACMAKPAERIHQTESGVLLGSPEYMSPEQAMDPRRVDHRSDIYSLGATLFFLVTGEPVFACQSVAELMAAHLQEKPRSLTTLDSAIPEAFNAIVSQMLEKDPNARFQDYASLLDALERCDQEWKGAAVNHAATGAPGPSIPTTMGRPRFPGPLGGNWGRLVWATLAIGIFTAFAGWAMPWHDWSRTHASGRWATEPTQPRHSSPSLPEPAQSRDQGPTGTGQDLEVLVVVPMDSYWGPDFDAVCAGLEAHGLRYQVASSQSGEAVPSDQAVSLRRAKVNIVLNRESVLELRPDIVLFTGAYPIRSLEFSNAESEVASRLIQNTLHDRGWVGAVSGAIDVIAQLGLLNDRRVAATKYLKPSTLINDTLRWDLDSPVVRAAPGAHILTANSAAAAQDLVAQMVTLARTESAKQVPETRHTR